MFILTVAPQLPGFWTGTLPVPELYSAMCVAHARCWALCRVVILTLSSQTHSSLVQVHPCIPGSALALAGYSKFPVGVRGSTGLNPAGTIIGALR